MARYKGRTVCAVMLVSVLLTTVSNDAFASSDYQRCHREAQQISGYYGQESRGVIGGGLRGGLRGAAAGAATGWVVGADSGKAAKRGAALGALIGGVKAAAESNEIARKRETYDRALDRCLNR